jgi:nicotinate-nucleotide adenylyltransferase
MPGDATRDLRLGVIGGTFDPPHYGHLVLAENAAVQLELDRVLFVPAGQPPHKPDRPITEARHRVAMVEVVVADNAAFRFSRVDVERSGPHYTVDMLGILQGRYPSATFFFLIGGDSLAEFVNWRDPAGILEQAQLVVMRRPGWRADLTSLREVLPGIEERLTWLDAPHLEISGTDLRRRVAQGLPIRYLVPPPIERYVREHRLYRSNVPTYQPTNRQKHHKETL